MSVNLLPPGWVTVPLEQVAEVQLGKMLDKAKNTGTPRPCLRNVNVRWAGFDLGDVAQIRMSEAEANKFSIRDGDVLVCEGGEPGRSAVWTAGKTDLTYQKALHRVRVTAALNPWLLSRQLHLDALTGVLARQFTGSTIKHLPQVALQRYEVLVPPPAEQQRIADKLDTVLARVDACRDSLARVTPMLKRFRQSVLAAATSGRLTEDWRAQHGAMSINPETGLPATWSMQTVSSYAKNHNGARVPISEELRRDRKGAFPYYGASGPIDTIDGYTHDGMFLLVGEDGANLLSRSKPIAFTARGKIWVNNHAHVLSCSDEASLDYLGFVINAMDLAPFVTGSAQPKLTKKNLDQLPVPAPPASETIEVVRRVEALFAFADRLEACLAQARTTVDRLTPSLLAKAFRGELVPQDPADEPAGELLKRLATVNANEREGRTGTQRRRRQEC